MKFVDVHAHLDSKEFEKDLDSVIENCKKSGVKWIISSGVNPSTNRRVLELSKKYDIVKCSFGIYPVDAIANKIENVSDDFARFVEKFDVDEELAWIEEHKNDCVAIGECGLDYKVIPNTEELQKEVFQKVIDLAKKIDKMLIVHTRKAEADVIDMLEENNCKKVVLHCFMGKKALIRRGVENGWFFSVPAIITRLEHFKTLVKLVPLNQLLTETDAPYLPAVSGERCDSSHIAFTIKEIAKIKGVSEDEVGEVLFGNAKGLFGDK